jgi:hypothetical protein
VRRFFSSCKDFLHSVIRINTEKTTCLTKEKGLGLLRLIDCSWSSSISYHAYYVSSCCAYASGTVINSHDRKSWSHPRNSTLWKNIEEDGASETNRFGFQSQYIALPHLRCELKKLFHTLKNCWHCIIFFVGILSVCSVINAYNIQGLQYS